MRLRVESLCDISGCRDTGYRAIGVCEPDAAICAARAEPATVAVLLRVPESEEPDALATSSPLFFLLFEPPDEPLEGRGFSGDDTAGSCGWGCRAAPASCTGGCSDGASAIASALAFVCGCGRVFLRRRFGLLFVRLNGLDLGREASRSDCADAWAAILPDERPACCVCRSSAAMSMPWEDAREDDRDASGREGAMVFDYALNADVKPRWDSSPKRGSAASLPTVSISTQHTSSREVGRSAAAVTNGVENERG